MPKMTNKAVPVKSAYFLVFKIVEITKPKTCMLKMMPTKTQKEGILPIFIVLFPIK